MLSQQESFIHMCTHNNGLSRKNQILRQIELTIDDYASELDVSNKHSFEEFKPLPHGKFYVLENYRYLNNQEMSDEIYESLPNYTKGKILALNARLHNLEPGDYLEVFDKAVLISLFEKVLSPALHEESFESLAKKIRDKVVDSSDCESDIRFYIDSYVQQSNIGG